MSSKSQKLLTGDIFKALLHFLPALAFISFMINISTNNQSQVSSAYSNQNNSTEVVSQPTESPSQSNVSSQYGASQSSKLSEGERKLARELIESRQRRYREQYEFSQRNPNAYRASLEQTRRMNEDAQLRRDREDALMNSSFNNN